MRYDIMGDVARLEIRAVCAAGADRALPMSFGNAALTPKHFRRKCDREERRAPAVNAVEENAALTASAPVAGKRITDMVYFVKRSTITSLSGAITYSLQITRRGNRALNLKPHLSAPQKPRPLELS